jgi:hypothetical protein
VRALLALLLLAACATTLAAPKATVPVPQRAGPDDRGALRAEADAAQAAASAYVDGHSSETAEIERLTVLERTMRTAVSAAASGRRADVVAARLAIRAVRDYLASRAK